MGGQYRVGLGVSQKGAASTGGKTCAERTAGRCSAPKAPRKLQQGPRRESSSHCLTATCHYTKAAGSEAELADPGGARPPTTSPTGKTSPINCIRI